MKAKKSRENPAKIPIKFPDEKLKKNHRRASAGAQGENNHFFREESFNTRELTATDTVTNTDFNLFTLDSR